MTYPTTLVHVSIDRPAHEVYSFASDPRHLPEWAAGLSSSTLTPEGETWIAESPMGRVRIGFAPKNGFGIIDHHVTLPNGITVHNPLRVQANGDGADVIFTLHRLPTVSDPDFQADAARVRADLNQLKEILEGR